MDPNIAEDIFKCIFLNENDRTPIARSPTGKKPVSVQVMDKGRAGDKSLFEPMMTKLVNAYMRH